jgi:hypothetical protein
MAIAAAEEQFGQSHALPGRAQARQPQLLCNSSLNFLHSDFTL